MTTQLYRHYDKDGALLYVGVSVSAMQRLKQHQVFSAWFDDITRVEIENVATREQALRLEREAIRKEHPRHNIMGTRGAELAAVERAAVLRTERDLYSRIVQLKPIYTRAEAAALLGISSNSVKILMEEGRLGSMQHPSSAERRCISGWQMLEYIEHLETLRPGEVR